MRHALLAPALFVLAAPASAADFDALVAKALPKATEQRHQIRRNPELSNQEVETAKLVAAHLKSLGMEVRTGVAKTGVIGILEGGQPGPVVAVRADMDALPVTEATDLPFKSVKRGVFEGNAVGIAHACGHDIHTSVQLGVASVLAAMRKDLKGTVMFIFQPAEEGAPNGEEGGADLMMKEGIFKDLRPAAIFALHSFPDWEVGEVAVTSGPVYASSDTWYATIKGKQAHGAYPHLAIDPVLMAAEAVQSLQSIRSRSLPPREAGVVTVGVIRGGERFNIIPAEVQLAGTVRTYSSATQDLIEQRMREILDGVTRAGGGSYTLDYQRANPPTINDPALTAWARSSLVARLGAQAVVDGEPTMGAEDFPFFLQDGIPGFYFRLGVTKPGTQNGALHTPTFRPDDGAIQVGIRAMSGLVVDFLAR